MSQAIRDAAQALLDAEDVYDIASSAHMKMPEGWRDGASLVKAANTLRMCRETLRAALSAPQPTADERVAEHMRLVESAADDWAGFILHGSDHLKLSEASFSAVEQSARALLIASQEDSEHAAMYRWLRDQIKDEASRVAAQALLWNHNSRTELDAAIRAAMSAKETK